MLQIWIFSDVERDIDVAVNNDLGAISRDLLTELAYHACS